MNPSRIKTPLDKKFDEWWIRFRDRPLKYDVYIRRNRDIEAEDSNGEFISAFYAVPNRKSLEKINEASFPQERIEAKTYDELREKVLSLVNSWLNTTWEKVIVIYLEGAVDQRNLDNTATIKDQNVLKFDFNVGYRSKDGQFWKRPDSTYVSRRMSDMVRSYARDGSYHWVPWSEDMESSLNDLRTKFQTLATGIRQLVFDRTDDFVRWAQSNPQPLLTP